MKEEIEEWRAVVGFEGQYEVSDHGRVRSLDRLDFRGYRRKGKVLSPGKQVANAGYLQLTVHLRGPKGFRSYPVSRFVAEAFIPYPPGWQSGVGLHVDHRNGDGTCNFLSNLRWLTPSQNARAFSRPRSKKTSKYRGVYRPYNNGRWVARATVNGKKGSYYIGTFDSEEEAALAFNKVALENGYLPEALNVLPPPEAEGVPASGSEQSIQASEHGGGNDCQEHDLCPVLQPTESLLFRRRTSLSARHGHAAKRHGFRTPSRRNMTAPLYRRKKRIVRKGPHRGGVLLRQSGTLDCRPTFPSTPQRIHGTDSSTAAVESGKSAAVQVVSCPALPVPGIQEHALDSTGSNFLADTAITLLKPV